MSKLLGAICIVKETFDEYSNGDGPDATLNKKELTELLKKEILGDSAPSEEIDVFFNTLDTDGDGVVNYEEYGISNAEVDKFFKMLDEDGDGVVDYMEYVTFVASFCLLLQCKDA
ncbi:Ictacalcin [Liparis tanakae]|uniref:Protein S100 n=1 Tax=Liparis tanakae TaxID=230148 RepID=A0A4Z2I4J8_9TELE|nr:Ictacalcin [Liparis tanakae]